MQPMGGGLASAFRVQAKPECSHMPSFRIWIPPLAAALLIAAPLSAQASVTEEVANFLGLGKPAPVEDIPAPTADAPVTVTAPGSIAATVTAPGSIAATISLSDFATPSLPTSVVSQLTQPSVETPLKKLFCVEYARALTGLAIFGDAKFWWERARNLYARVAMPAEHAVMVFTPSSRLKKGHVAVVSAILSKREIRVEQANWQNHGEIDHAMPVMDVSAKNDWSQVRVWDMRSQAFGRVYAVSGFIAKHPVQQAAND
jgi:hypothetical protein